MDSSASLIVYVDFKSPYAYVALGPTRALADELGIEVDWRPLTLDIPSFAGSARLGERDQVVESRRSPDQWAWVRYAYRDARRYGALRGLVVRGTTKIWDSSLAAIGMLWAKQQGAAVLRRYMDTVFERFWKRELDIEDVAVIEGVLRESGASTEGFRTHAAGEGRAAHDAEQRAIFASGIFGVPAYVVAGEELWGREHLPRIRWLLTGRTGPSPDIAYERAAASRATAKSAAGRHLSVSIDFKSPAAYLALEPTCALADELGIRIDWQPFVVAPRRKPVALDTDADRGARHRQFRAVYQARDLERYAEARGLELRDPDREADSTPAALALLWLSGQPEPLVRDFVRRVFGLHFSGALALDDPEAIARVLAEVGAPTAGLESFAREQGPAALEALRAELVEAGVFDVPAYRLAGELFIGRQHLPRIGELLSGAPASRAEERVS